MPYFTTADIKEREEAHTRLFAREILWTYSGDLSAAVGYNWDFLLKFYARDESSQSRSFHRPTGRRDAAFRRGIAGLVKDSPGAKRRRKKGDVDGKILLRNFSQTIYDLEIVILPSGFYEFFGFLKKISIFFLFYFWRYLSWRKGSSRS